MGRIRVFGCVVSWRQGGFMSQMRRKFSSQFKAEAVQFVIQTGHSVSEIANELENHEGTQGNWVKQCKYENQ